MSPKKLVAALAGAVVLLASTTSLAQDAPDAGAAPVADTATPPTDEATPPEGTSAPPEGTPTPPTDTAAPAAGDAFDFGPPATETTPQVDDSQLTLNVYGDAGYTVRDNAASNNDFSAAHFELLPSYSTGRLSFLAEVMLEIGGNSLSVDVERIQVAYVVANWLRLKMGRFHSANGYYNDTYHHGAIFQLATDRPFLVQFEDGGGLMEAHLVGVAADGTVSLGDLGDLRYDLEVGNGRLPHIEDVATTDSFKNFKRVNARVRWLPSFLEGLVIGFTGAADEIPAGMDPLMPTNRMFEAIVGSHVAYMENHFHVLFEGDMVLHHDTTTGIDYTTWGGFAELGYAIDDWTPYVRFEQISFAGNDDPYFATNVTGGVGDVRDLRIGINWHALPGVVFKLEGRHFERPGFNQQSALFQCAFGF